MSNDEPLTTWREALQKARGDDTTPIVHIAPDESVMDVRFYAGYGGAYGPAILVWTEERVYFPVQYDGAEWLGSAPRNPTNEGQDHEGGG